MLRNDTDSYVPSEDAPNQPIDQAKACTQTASGVDISDSQAPPPDPTKETKPKPRIIFDRHALTSSTLLAAIKINVAFILFLFALIGETTVL